MPRFFVPAAPLLIVGSAAFGQARIVITEVMYNPNSKEPHGESEWVEIANVGTESITIKDWHLDDEDKGNWGDFSCTLAPGGVAVLVNADAVKETEFREAWDDASAALSYQVIPVRWGGIANVPSKDNEVLQLQDASNTVICEVRQAGEWPKVNKPDGPSIWLSDPKAADTNIGKLWRKSESGSNGAHENKKTAHFDGKDFGSPGYVPGLASAPPASPTAKPATKPASTAPAASQPAATAPATQKSNNNIEY